MEKLIADTEDTIAFLENSIKEMEIRLATPEGASDISLYTRYADQKKNLSQAMDTWTELTMELEDVNNSLIN